MNIIQIVPMMEVGGVETGTLEISRELVKLGHRVIVVSGGGRLVKELESGGVRHITLPVYKKSLFTIIAMIRQLRDIIEKEDVHIVHARSRVPAIIGFFATRGTEADFITTAHGYYSSHLFSRVMGWGKYVIVPSSVIGRYMIENFDVPRERIRFIPRGVDLERFRFNPIDPSRQKSEYKIGIIGRITPIKGHAFFLQSVARVVKLFPMVRIWIVGDPPKDKPEYKERLLSLANQLRIQNIVEFLGTRYDMPKIMSDLDIVVFPSLGQEAFGRVIVEAGASGVPIVATRIGGAIDIIEHEKTGLLVEPNNIMQMMEAILRLLQDREFAKGLALEARKRIEKEYTLTKMVEATLKVYEEARRKRILVIKIGAIGDVILAIPSLRVIRNNFPEAYITVLSGMASRAILKRCPYIDEIIPYDRRYRHRGIKGLLKIAGTVRRKGFDISLDFQNNKTSHIIAWLGCVPKRYGYSNRRLGFLLNNKLRYVKMNLGPVEEQFKILRKAGINTIGMSKSLELWPSKEDFLYVDDFLKDEWISESQKLVGINIGASWQTKRWPLKYFARLIDMLSSKDIRTVITGSEEEIGLGEELIDMTNSRVINAIGETTILQLAALIKRCKVFITSDSAPMHIASAMGVDFIALFGPTDPKRHFEPTNKGTVIYKDVRCGPCYKSDCKKMICMKKITVDEVFKIVMEKISS